MAKRNAVASWLPKVFTFRQLFKVEEEGNNLAVYRLERKTTENGRARERIYQGFATPSGCLNADKEVSKPDKINEYGFTNAVLDLCPLFWKEMAGDRWLDFLMAIIRIESPSSYLASTSGNEIVCRELAPLRQALIKSLPVSLEDLKIWFQGVNIVTVGSQRIAVTMTEAQKAKAKELGIIHMEVLKNEQV